MPGELVPIVFIIAVAAVAILRPLAKRIGSMIEQSHERRATGSDPRVDRMVQLVERLVDRMDALEDRLDFAERMLERQRMPGQLGEGTGPAKSSPREQSGPRTHEP